MHFRERERERVGERARVNRDTYFFHIESIIDVQKMVKENWVFEKLIFKACKVLSLGGKIPFNFI